MGSIYSKVNLLCNQLFSGLVVIMICFTVVITTPAKWSKVESNTLAWLRAVYFINEDHGWVGGSNGTLLTTADGGLTWRQNRKFTNDNIRDLYFSDAEHGWLLCEREVYSGTSKSSSYLLKTSDGGVSWDAIELVDSHDRLVRFFFTRDGYGYAVGEGGGIWQMLDDKKSWKRVGLPVSYLILGVSFLDDSRGVLVGGGGTVLFTRDGGVEWERAAMSHNATSRFNSVFFIDRENGWTAGAEGKIFVTNNGGKFWRRQVSGTNENLSDVFFVNLNEGFAIGDNGTMVETKTGGSKWVPVTTGIKSPLEKLFFIGSVGFAVGYGGVILMNRPSP
jgi:photosystem II stability/assembly factor-like uncharacterized protein